MKKYAFPIVAAVMLLASSVLGACSLMDRAASAELGNPCNDDTRVMRASMLTDLLDERYGGRHAGEIAELRDDVARMKAAFDAGADLDAPGKVYKAHFVKLSVKVLASAGISVSIGGFHEAIEKLSQVPDLVAGINIIKSAVQLRCAKDAAPNPTASVKAAS
ncbi:MAG: hypothetical protein CMM61_13565 [Rhodospirillaceae bacterium]|nr:hypothetical protein [Rhodospirillaceae bacterium]